MNDATAAQIQGMQTQMAAEAKYNDEKKSSTAIWLLWLFAGAFGGHRFYIGSKGIAIAQLLTLGGLGIWALIDGFFVPRLLREKNAEIRTEVYGRYGLDGSNGTVVAPAIGNGI